jgi:hypothetical protein
MPIGMAGFGPAAAVVIGAAKRGAALAVVLPVDSYLGITRR